MADPILIYGATGYTGRLLARAARARGLRPILAGRDASRVAAVAAPLGLEHRVALPGPGLEAALEGVEVVVNAAGPFAATFGPMVDACLRVGAHYLDLTGEIDVIEQVARRDAEARARRVMLMPAVGLDVVASDCLVLHVARRLRGANRLALGITGLEQISRGSAKTTAAQFGQAVRVRRGGRIVGVAPGSLRRAFDYGAGPRWSAVVSWADVATAYYTAGIPDIETYYEEILPLRMMDVFSRHVGQSPMAPLARLWLELHAHTYLDGPTDEERARSRVVFVAHVEDGAGRHAAARISTPEAYTFTCETSLAIVDRVRRGDLESGFQTPARVYGPDFVLTFPGVRREDLEVH